MSPGLPLGALETLRRDLQALFDEIGEIGGNAISPDLWRPPADVLETEVEVVLLLEVPGIDARDLVVEACGSLVTVFGQRLSPRSPLAAGARYQCLERAAGAFRRQFHLPTRANSRGGRATLASGVLRISFPKVVEKRQQVRHLAIADEEPCDE